MAADKFAFFRAKFFGYFDSASLSKLFQDNNIYVNPFSRPCDSISGHWPIVLIFLLFVMEFMIVQEFRMLKLKE